MFKRKNVTWMIGIIVTLMLPAVPSWPQDNLQSPESAERFSLKTCIEIASQKNQDIEQARHATAEMEAERKSVRGKFGPAVRLEANNVNWDSPFGVAVDLPGLTTAPVLAIRERNTTQYSASVVQPLTGLWTVYAGYKAQVSALTASQFQEKATRHDTIFAVTDAYLQALEAQRGVSIAESGFKTIEAHTAKARRFFENKLIARNELLEAEVRKAEAKSRLLSAQGGARLARANLAFQMGLPADREIWPEEIDLGPSADHVGACDPERRPELAMLNSRIEQARAGQMAARARLLPDVNAVFKWQGSDGIYMEPDRAWFGGVMLSWNIWDWGGTYYGLDTAKARVLQAKTAQVKAREGMRLEIVQAGVELDTSRSQLDVTSSAVVQAELNLQSVQRRFDVQSAGSTDVLDAQVLLDRARFNEARAHYSVSRAYVKLRRAQGLNPLPSTGGNEP